MMRTILSFIVIAAVVCAAAPALAVTEGGEDAAIVADILLVRPVGVVAIVVGSVIFIVSLPFTIPSHSVGTAARVLVAEPFAYTFLRPIGCPDYKWKPEAYQEP